MEIDTRTVALACKRLLRHVEDLGHKKIELDEDFYWQIPEENLYDMTSEPKKFDVGQLSDDWEEVKSLAGKADTEIIAYGLVWVGAIVRAIGEKIVR